MIELVKQDVWVMDTREAGKIEKGNFTLGSLIELKQVYVLTEDELEKLVGDAMWENKLTTAKNFIQSITKK